MEEKTDEALYRIYLEKADNEAFKILLERHREPLALFLYGMLHNMEDAEDVMLDAYAVAASGTTKFKEKSSFKTWLYAIARNLALKHLRKKHFFFIPLNEETAEIPEENGSPDMELLKTEENRILYEALNKIHADYRQVLHLIYFEEMDNGEVAKVLGKNKKQIYNLAARGKQALKETMQSLGYER